MHCVTFLSPQVPLYQAFELLPARNYMGTFIVEWNYARHLEVELAKCVLPQASAWTWPLRKAGLPDGDDA